MTAPAHTMKGADVADETQALLNELARVKALFQARAIAAVIGLPQPDKLETHPPERNANDKS